MTLFKHVLNLATVGAVICATSALAVSCSKDTSDDTGSNGNTSGTDAGVKASLDDGVVGKACTAATECKGTGGTCASSIGVGTVVGLGTPAAGGYCTAACSTDDECGTGVCVGAVAQLSVKGQCLLACSKDADCGREGYSCGELDLKAIAAQAGAAAADAGIAVPDAQVPEVPKACVPKPKTVTLAANTAGKACTANTDCGEGTCNATDRLSGAELPDGYCTGACNADTDCGTGGACYGAIITPLFSTAGNCVKSCTAKSDCRTGYDCVTVGQNANAVKFCYLPAPVTDAGVSTDAGSPPTTDAGSTTTDAGATDAGAADAG